MRRLERIRGRSDDMMILRGVNVFPSQIEEQVLAHPGLAPHFQIELRRDSRLDTMRVLVEATAAADAAELARLGEGLHKRIRQMWGINVEIAAGLPGTVPRSDGKAVRIVDHRPKP